MRKMTNKKVRVFSIGVILTLLLGMSIVPKYTPLQVSGYGKVENYSSLEYKKSRPTQVNPKYISQDLKPSEESTTSENIERFADLSSQLVVKLSQGTDPEQIAQSVQAEILRQGPLDYLTLTIPSERMSEAFKVLGQSPGVLSVNPVQKIKTTEVTIPQITDSHYSEQWGLSKAEVQKAWGLGATGQGITIATIDTGIDVNHPDLKNNLVEGYNAITGKTGLSAVQDNNGHGTHVAGIAAAGLNGEGIVGVAYRAKIMPIKAMNRLGEGTDDVVADGVIWAADHGAQIINLSLGSKEETNILRDAIQYAQAKGALLVAAAGNKEENLSLDSIAFPAAEPGVLAVTATDLRDQLASFSLTGPQASLAAPGVNILSDYWQNRSGYASIDGTSMASPFVAGVAALVWGAHPELTAEQVKVLLEDSALDLGTPGRDSEYGFGRVNAYWAVRFAAEPETLPTPANLTWAGGKVKGAEVGQRPSMSAELTVPSRAFGMDQEKRVSVELNFLQEAPGFPQGIIPAGEGILIKWDSLSQKTLRLTVLLESDQITLSNNLSVEKDQLGFLYHWTGSRWLKVGGGIGSSEMIQGITAGITEPGIYRVGLESFPGNNRIAGEDRIQTAVQISQANFQSGADTVLLARSDDFPDALAGAPLAYKNHAPILLTEVAALPDSVLSELKRLNPQKIILLGGTGAISTTVEAKLKALAPVQRIGGVNRFATASGIATELGMIGEAVLVNGNNYPDAITMAAIAAQRGIPILLTETKAIPSETDSTLKKFAVSQTEIIGGEGVVSPLTFKSLPSPTRFSGIDRYATAATVLQAYPPEGRLVFLATGENFPDALTGGVVAALNNSRIVLVPPTGPSAKQRAILQPWSGRSAFAFGGSTIVPEEILNQTQSLIQ